MELQLLYNPKISYRSSSLKLGNIGTEMNLKKRHNGSRNRWLDLSSTKVQQEESFKVKNMPEWFTQEREKAISILDFWTITKSYIFNIQNQGPGLIINVPAIHHF